MNSYQKQPPEDFYKKYFLKNFAIFRGNTCVEVSFNKVAGLEASTHVFSCDISETPILKNGRFFSAIKHTSC